MLKEIKFKIALNPNPKIFQPIHNSDPLLILYL